MPTNIQKCGLKSNSRTSSKPKTFTGNNKKCGNEGLKTPKRFHKDCKSSDFENISFNEDDFITSTAYRSSKKLKTNCDYKSNQILDDSLILLQSGRSKDLQYKTKINKERPKTISKSQEQFLNFTVDDQPSQNLDYSSSSSEYRCKHNLVFPQTCNKKSLTKLPLKSAKNIPKTTMPYLCSTSLTLDPMLKALRDGVKPHKEEILKVDVVIHKEELGDPFVVNYTNIQINPVDSKQIKNNCALNYDPSLLFTDDVTDSKYVLPSQVNMVKITKKGVTAENEIQSDDDDKKTLSDIVGNLSKVDSIDHDFVSPSIPCGQRIPFAQNKRCASPTQESGQGIENTFFNNTPPPSLPPLIKRTTSQQKLIVEVSKHLNNTTHSHTKVNETFCEIIPSQGDGEMLLHCPIKEEEIFDHEMDFLALNKENQTNKDFFSLVQDSNCFALSGRNGLLGTPNSSFFENHSMENASIMDLSQNTSQVFVEPSHPQSSSIMVKEELLENAFIPSSQEMQSLVPNIETLKNKSISYRSKSIGQSSFEKACNPCEDLLKFLQQADEIESKKTTNLNYISPKSSTQYSQTIANLPVPQISPVNNGCSGQLNEGRDSQILPVNEGCSEQINEGRDSQISPVNEGCSEQINEDRDSQISPVNEGCSEQINEDRDSQMSPVNEGCSEQINELHNNQHIGKEQITTFPLSIPKRNELVTKSTSLVKENESETKTPVLVKENEFVTELSTLAEKNELPIKSCNRLVNYSLSTGTTNQENEHSQSTVNQENDSDISTVRFGEASLPSLSNSNVIDNAIPIKIKEEKSEPIKVIKRTVPPKNKQGKVKCNPLKKKKIPYEKDETEIFQTDEFKSYDKNVEVIFDEMRKFFLKKKKMAAANTAVTFKIKFKEVEKNEIKSRVTYRIHLGDSSSTVERNTSLITFKCSTATNNDNTKTRKEKVSVKPKDAEKVSDNPKDTEKVSDIPKDAEKVSVEKKITPLPQTNNTTSAPKKDEGNWWNSYLDALPKSLFEIGDKAKESNSNEDPKSDSKISKDGNSSKSRNKEQSKIKLSFNENRNKLDEIPEERKDIPCNVDVDHRLLEECLNRVDKKTKKSKKEKKCKREKDFDKVENHVDDNKNEPLNGEDEVTSENDSRVLVKKRKKNRQRDFEAAQTENIGNEKDKSIIKKKKRPLITECVKKKKPKTSSDISLISENTKKENVEPVFSNVEMMGENTSVPAEELFNSFNSSKNSFYLNEKLKDVSTSSYNEANTNSVDGTIDPKLPGTKNLSSTKVKRSSENNKRKSRKKEKLEFICSPIVIPNDKPGESSIVTVIPPSLYLGEVVASCSFDIHSNENPPKSPTKNPASTTVTSNDSSHSKARANKPKRKGSKSSKKKNNYKNYYRNDSYIYKNYYKNDSYINGENGQKYGMYQGHCNDSLPNKKTPPHNFQKLSFCKGKRRNLYNVPRWLNRVPLLFETPNTFYALSK